MQNLSPINLGFSPQQTKAVAVPVLASIADIPNNPPGIYQIGTQFYIYDGTSYTIVSNVELLIRSFNAKKYPQLGVLPNVTCSPGINFTAPTPYDGAGNGTNLHGSIKTAPNSFNGYKYWMAFTPYINADSVYENPCVVASNDLLTWTAPSPNPVVPKPSTGATHYNSDTSLCFSSDFKTLYLIYRTVTTTFNVLVRKTTDGINWSAPVTIFSSSTATKDYASPSLVYNSGTDRFELFSHDFINVSRPVERAVSTTNDPMGAWGTQSAITLAPTGGKNWWHSEFMLVNGIYIGVIQEPTTNANDGDTYLVYSPDGINFTRQSVLPGSYRPGIFLDENNNPYLLVSKLIQNYFTVYPLYSDSVISGFISDYVSYLAGTLAPLIRDTFTRTNAASLGNTDNGIPWITQLGTAATDGTTGGFTTSGCRAVVPVNAQDYYAEFTLAQVSDNANFIIFRASNPTATFYRFGVAGGIFYFQKYVAGNLVTNKPITGNIAALFISGAKLGVETKGNKFSFFVNRKCVHTEYDLDTLNPVLTGNYIGAQENHTTTYMKIDDFIVIPSKY